MIENLNITKKICQLGWILLVTQVSNCGISIYTCIWKFSMFPMFAGCFCGTIQSAGSRPIVSTFRHFKVILGPIKPLKFYILPILNALMSGPINYHWISRLEWYWISGWNCLVHFFFLILKLITYQVKWIRIVFDGRYKSTSLGFDISRYLNLYSKPT